MWFLSVFTIYLNLSTAGSSAGPLQNASFSYDSYQVFSLLSSFLECCIQTLTSSTRCLVMEGFATEDDASLKDSNVVKPTWILPCTDSKQRCFLFRNLYCLKIVWIDVGTLLSSTAEKWMFTLLQSGIFIQEIPPFYGG